MGGVRSKGNACCRHLHRETRAGQHARGRGGGARVGARRAQAPRRRLAMASSGGRVTGREKDARATRYEREAPSDPARIAPRARASSSPSPGGRTPVASAPPAGVGAVPWTRGGHVVGCSRASWQLKQPNHRGRSDMSPDLDSRTVSRPLVCQRGHAGACTTSSGARRRVASSPPARHVAPHRLLRRTRRISLRIRPRAHRGRAGVHGGEPAPPRVVRGGDRRHGQARRRVRHVRRRRADARRRSPPRHRVEQRLFLLGPLVMAAASGPVALSLGRFVVGLGVGASAVVVPAYVAEMSPPSAAAPSSSPTNSCSASA